VVQGILRLVLNQCRCPRWNESSWNRDDQLRVAQTDHWGSDLTAVDHETYFDWENYRVSGKSVAAGPTEEKGEN
jgi:hypothetical protein